jgi:hypothetical protein
MSTISRSQELYPDTTRTGIWFRGSVSKIFNTSRIPRKDCDILSSPPPPDDILSQYVVVIANNWFYALRVHKPSLGLLPASKILERMTAIARDASTRGKGPMIGALSADDRDSWAEVKYTFWVHGLFCSVFRYTESLLSTFIVIKKRENPPNYCTILLLRFPRFRNARTS